MAKGVRKNTDVKVRDYINKYGSKYGIQNQDIGYYQDEALGDTGMMVTVGGVPIGTPSYLDDTQGVSYMNQDLLQAAIDKYAQGQGMKDMSAPAPYTAPEPYKAPATPAPYASPYAGKIDALLAEVMNPAAFNYNPDTDPVYQSYKSAYNREGNRAMTNAMGEAAGMTGGRLNSWAVSAGQQAQDYYNSKLNDVIPELYNTAYGMYRDKLNDQRSNINTLGTLEQNEYGKYRDTMGDYQNERNFGYNQYENDKNYNRGIYEGDRAFDRSTFEGDRAYNRDVYSQDRMFGAEQAQNKITNQYNQDRAERSDMESDRNFNYTLGRNEIEDTQWLAQFDAEERQRQIQNAYENRQISAAEMNALINKTESEWRMNPENPDNQAEVQEEDTIGPLYVDMMDSGDPAKWIKDNYLYLTDDEFKTMINYIPKESMDDKLLAIISNFMNKK